MPDLRRNLQVKQDTVQGDDVNDGNGWPTPLTDPSSPLKMVVSNGSRGEISGIAATSTSRQNDVSTPEGRSSIQGISVDGLTISIKKTVGDSL